jgi:polar amino acid transport system substrate-binding protein
MCSAPARRRFFSALLALSLATCVAAAQAVEVTVFTSSSSPPLIVGDHGGIYRDMIAYLNRQNLGLTFKLAYIPRKRLQVKVEEDSIDGIVIGMMPAWFGDAAQNKYLWTVPFQQDRFQMVVPIASPIRLEAPLRMRGRTAGLVLGYAYPGIDRWIDQRGMVRSYAPSEETSLEKLTLDRVDSVIVSELVARYYLRTHNLQQKYRMFSLPAVGTERRFLVPFKQRAVYDKLAPVIRKIKDDPEWIRLMNNYR